MTTVYDFVVWRRGDATHAQPEVWGAADPRTACDMYVASNVDLMEAAGPGPLDTLHFDLLVVRADGRGSVGSWYITVTMSSAEAQADRGEP